MSVKHLRRQSRFPTGSASIPGSCARRRRRLQAPGVRRLAGAAAGFPESPTPDPIPDDWNFERPHPLPDDFFDNGYAGWDGRARIDWPDRGVAVDIEADAGTRYFHVYSLNADCPYFCFEPVTHPNNAFGKPGAPEENGLRVLAPGEETSQRVRFTAKRL